MSARKREGVRPTHNWALLVPLFEWPEQERYEKRSAPWCSSRKFVPSDHRPIFITAFVTLRRRQCCKVGL
jgi:hypothetical protein